MPEAQTNVVFFGKSPTYKPETVASELPIATIRNKTRDEIPNMMTGVIDLTYLQEIADFPEVKKFIGEHKMLIRALGEVISRPNKREEKITAASGNQAFAGDFLTALTLNSQEVNDNITKFMTVLRILATEKNPFGIEALKLMNSARAQAGMAFLLEQNGYQIRFPNPLDNDEISEWDLHGVDFVAYNKDTGALLLIDSKAREFDEDNNPLNTALVDNGSLPDNWGKITKMAAVSLGLDQKTQTRLTVKKYVITIPTGPNHMTELGKIINSDISKKILEGVQHAT